MLLEYRAHEKTIKKIITDNVKPKENDMKIKLIIYDKTHVFNNEEQLSPTNYPNDEAGVQIHMYQW